MALFGSKQATKPLGTPAPRTASASSDLPRLLGLGWLGLKAADTVAEARFLENVLHLKYVDESTTAAGGHVVRYRAGTLDLELLEGGTAWATRPKPRQGQPDISLIPNLHFNDLAGFVSGLKEQEIPGTRVFEQGWGASVLFFDPERNLWQADEIRVEPALADEILPGIGALWLSVEDFAAQVAFYRDVLGLEEVNEGDYVPPITETAERYNAAHPVILPATPPNNNANPTADTAVEPTIVPPPDDNTTSPEQHRNSRVAPLGAVFQAGSIRLALSPGGQRLEDNRQRVWGQDTAFLPGFQTNDLDGFARKLEQAGVPTTGPYPFYYVNSTPRGPQRSPGSALRFFDPEGHPLQVYQ